MTLAEIPSGPVALPYHVHDRLLGDGHILDEYRGHLLQSWCRVGFHNENGSGVCAHETCRLSCKYQELTRATEVIIRDDEVMGTLERTLRNSMDADRFAHISRPRFTQTPELVETVRELVDEDCLITTRELDEGLDVGKSTVYEVLTQDLQLLNMAYVWVPHRLTEDNKAAHINGAKNIRDIFFREGVGAFCNNLYKAICNKLIPCNRQRPQCRVEKMEGDSTDTAFVKPNYYFALALFTENKRRKTFNCVSAIAGYVNVDELVRWGFYLDVDPKTASKGYPSDDEDFNPNRKKMLCHAGRLWSFEFFPKRYIVSTDEMARWGLYYTGIRDETACIFCRLIIHNWEYGDNPYEEHRRFSPNCPLIRGRNIMDIPYENSLNPDDLTTEKEGKEMIDALNRRSPTSSFKSDASLELIVEEDADFHHFSGADAQGGEK
ncbi:unnamed protein product [Darwinula stevensoni]|uniref:Uncharacterized protein n=1 Tax=Darwinula stevensoni TaxID=69355 RepID=A0A7R8X9L9_9CRUS|nr:unnamed protein product [Darwinula stevensoni]CAG0891246.1 unnamed protein product [Darwinula stevensoni]